MCETDTFFDRCSIVNESNHSFDTDLLPTIIYLSVCTPLKCKIFPISQDITQNTLTETMYLLFTNRIVISRE